MGKDKNKAKKPVSRKESRKMERKQVKQLKHISKAHQPASTEGKALGPLQKILQQKNASKQGKVEETKVSKVSKPAPVRKDPYLEQEEMELERLAKLLGIDKKAPRKKAADKLNKEFDLYEGMGDGFGDFLMELDDLTDMVEGKSSRKSVFSGKDEDDNVGAEAGSGKSQRKLAAYGGHLIDEDEQEESDIEGDEEDEGEGSDNSEEMEEDMPSGEEDESSEGEGSDGMYNSEELDEGEGEDEGSYNSDEVDEDKEQQGSNDSDGSEEEGFGESDGEGSGDSEEVSGDEGDFEEEEGEEDAVKDLFTYRPAAGEDIYGRSTASTEVAADKPGKYVPPAKRKAALMEVDEKSESVQALRRQLNGLMNKLSDQSKDSIVRAIKGLFDRNSVTVASMVLRDAILSACAHPTQVMTSLIPIYAAIVAALHCSISVDVGASMVEHLTTALVTALAEATAACKQPKTSQSAGYIGTKLPANALLLMVYLYNLRVIHHTLIVDIMNALADYDPAQAGKKAADQASEKAAEFVELKVELLECLVNHCGASIRSDDPVSLRAVISALSRRLANLPPDAATADGSSSRLRFMFEALTDLKNNKSRRIQTNNAEVVKKLRKWLGGMKTVLGQKQAGDTCLRVGLQDLLNAETKGRWWRTGASWIGKQQEDAERSAAAKKAAAEAESSSKRAKTSAEKTEEEKLLALAVKLRMNTATRKNIFVVMMSSRDVTDAFERLSRLELKGKEDREVARVLAQCCSQERTYNAFYAELAKVLCSQHRQYKVTFQFVFWDTFKAMEDEGDEEGEAAILSERRAVNLARLLAALICSFQLPLTVIKPIEISTMSPSMVLFLSTLLLAIFKDKISEEDYQNVLDRVATSKDFAVVRDNLLFFLQKYLSSIPKGLDATDAKKMSQRRKTAIRTFEAMTVLDISRGIMKDDDDL